MQFKKNPKPPALLKSPNLWDESDLYVINESIYNNKAKIFPDEIKNILVLNIPKTLFLKERGSLLDLHESSTGIEFAKLINIICDVVKFGRDKPDDVCQQFIEVLFNQSAMPNNPNHDSDGDDSNFIGGQGEDIILSSIRALYPANAITNFVPVDEGHQGDDLNEPGNLSEPGGWIRQPTVNSKYGDFTLQGKVEQDIYGYRIWIFIKKDDVNLWKSVKSAIALDLPQG